MLFCLKAAVIMSGMKSMTNTICDWKFQRCTFQQLQILLRDAVSRVRVYFPVLLLRADFWLFCKNCTNVRVKCSSCLEFWFMKPFLEILHSCHFSHCLLNFRPPVALFDCLFRSMYIFLCFSLSLSLSLCCCPLTNDRELKQGDRWW